MSYRKLLVSFILALWAVVPSVSAADSVAGAPAGVYRLDPNHFSMLFRVDHLGFSHIVGRFNAVDATLTIDPARPEGSKLTAMIESASIDTNVDALDNFLKGASMLNSAAFPQITFEMTNIVLQREDTANVTGRLSIAGQTHEIELNVALVGAGVNRFENTYVLGFTATGRLARSDWGLSAYTPNVGDEVQFSFDGELIYSGP